MNKLSVLTHENILGEFLESFVYTLCHQVSLVTCPRVELKW